MNKINVSQLKRDLRSYAIDKSIKECIINNAEMHNQYVDRLLNGEKINPYIIWQLNTQVFKQLLDLKKLLRKSDGESDGDFLENLKNSLNDVEKR